MSDDTDIKKEEITGPERYWIARNAEDYFRANFQAKIKTILVNGTEKDKSSELVNLMVISKSNAGGDITGIEVNAIVMDRCSHCKHSEVHSLFIFSLGRFPGCCAYIVSYHSSVWYTWRRKGFGMLMQEMKEAFARITNHGRMVCTVNKTNKEEIGLLKKSGWKAVDEGVNPKTENTVIMYIKELL